MKVIKVEPLEQANDDGMTAGGLAVVPSALSSLPDGWRVVHLNEIEEIQLLQMRNGFPCGNNNQEQNGIPHLRPMNVNSSGEIDLLSVKFIETDRDISSYLLRDGDVIFNNTNSRELVGKTAIWHEQPIPYVLSNHMTFLRFASNSEVEPYYVALYFHLLWLNRYFEKIRRQHVNQASISLERLREVAIALPPLPEQRAIAQALRTVQEAKEARRREAMLERERKAALMQRLFTHGTRNEPRQMTAIGELPQSWQVDELANTCEFLQYGTSVRCDADDTGLPVLRIPNVVGGKIDTSDLKYVNLPDSVVQSLSLEIGDLLFVRTNGNKEYTGRCAVYQGELGQALYASYLIRARLKTNVLLPEFAQFYTMTAKGKEYLSGKALNAADGKYNINTQTIRAVLTPIPQPSEQAEIVEILRACDGKVAALEREAALLDELFRALLDELMTGRRRIKGEKSA